MNHAATLDPDAPWLLDLTRPLIAGMPVYPGDPPVTFRPQAEIEPDGYRLTELSLGTHTGTHLDAPRHYFTTGATVDQLPAERLVGPAVVVDLPPDRQNRLTVEALRKQADHITPGSRVLLRTGWEARWGEAVYFTDHPSLTISAALWLVERGVGLLGLDLPSPAVEPEEVHRVLLGGTGPIVIVENLINVSLLPTNFQLAVLPLPLKGLDGSPVRALAWSPAGVS